LNLAVAELGLRLSFELWLRNFNANDRRKPFPDALALEIFFILFQCSGFDGVTVDGSCQSGFETYQVRTTFNGVDVVGEGKNTLRITIVPLHGYFHRNPVLFAFEINDFRMNSGFGAVQMLHERQKPAFVEKLMFLLGSLIFDGNFYTAV